MKRYITKITALLLFATTIFTLFVLPGCSCNGSKDEEWGYFTVSFYDDRTTAYITGLTELGQQQKSIVIPKEIDGAAVVTLGEKTPMWEPTLREWHSDNLEKIFFTKRLRILYGTFDNCPNLTKAISVYGGYIDNTICKLYYANITAKRITDITGWMTANTEVK